MILIFTVLYAGGLYIFYLRYVPLIKPFQTVFTPILFAALALTAFNPRRGLMFFIFSFPLINNLPYFFGIHEPLPHAPTALVLFLFFFFGWLIHHVFSRDTLDLSHPVFKPMILFAAIVFLSGLLTLWKYTNFFPFLSDGIYELVVNVMGGTAGGAWMSTVFFTLNYLTGLAFFVVLFNTVRSADFARKIVVILCLATLISLVFGFRQHFRDSTFGNNPLSIEAGLLNATFKDALSFGVFLAMFIPVALGAILLFRKGKRLIAVTGVLGSFYMIFFAGSKSALAGLAVAILVFLVLAGLRMISRIRAGVLSAGKATAGILAGILFFSAGLIGFIKHKEHFETAITILKIRRTVARGTLRDMFYYREDVLWKTAVAMAGEFPLTGVGVGGFIIQLPNYAQEFDLEYAVPETAENYLLQVAAEMGAIGLFLVIWIAWEIVRQMRRSLRNIPVENTAAYLLVGAIAGLIAYGINLQAHTYIGSYEIKYTAWLFVGLIFALGRRSPDRDGESRSAESARKLVIPALILIIFFSSIHFRNTTRSLSLQSMSERFGFVQTFGFYETERTVDGREFRWMRKSGGLSLRVEDPRIEIPIHASHPDIQENPVEIQIYLVRELFRQKTLVDVMTLNGDHWIDHRLRLPAKPGEEVILLFKVSRTWNPLKETGVPDPRNLGIALGDIRSWRIP